MKKITKNKNILIIIGIICLTSIYLKGDNLTKNKKQILFSVVGSVVDVVDVHKLLEKMEVSSPKSDKEIRSFFYSYLLFEPAENIKVTIQNKLLKKSVMTGSKGNFTFTDIPTGEYEISAIAPLRITGIKNITRTAVVKKQIKVRSNRSWGKLQLRTDLINIKGCITDNNGKPVPNAKVIAVEILDESACVRTAKTWGTISDKNGLYELKRIPPVNFHRLGGILLTSGKLESLPHINIFVEATGFRQNKNNIPKIVLITEEKLLLARRTLKIYSKMYASSENITIKEKEGLLFPTSKENNIIGVDVKLNNIDK